MIEWRNTAENPPRDGQTCLTKMKHGLIEGGWNQDDGVFYGYYWNDLQWWATEWAPIEEI